MPPKSSRPSRPPTASSRPNYVPGRSGATRAQIKRRKAKLQKEYAAKVEAARQRIREKGTYLQPLKGAGVMGSSLAGLIMQYKWRDIAKATGITPNVISDYFSGRRTPNFPRGVAIARFLGVPPERLCDYLVTLQDRARLVAKAREVAHYSKQDMTTSQRREVEEAVLRRAFNSISKSA